MKPVPQTQEELEAAYADGRKAGRDRVLKALDVPKDERKVVSKAIKRGEYVLEPKGAPPAPAPAPSPPVASPIASEADRAALYTWENMRSYSHNGEDGLYRERHGAAIVRALGERAAMTAASQQRLLVIAQEKQAQADAARAQAQEAAAQEAARTEAVIASLSPHDQQVIAAYRQNEAAGRTLANAGLKAAYHDTFARLRAAGGR